MTINDPVKELKGVTSKITKQLDNLGIKTVRDLLFYFPKRYNDFSIITKIKDVRPGETCTISGKVLNIKNARSFRSRLTITEAQISDEDRTIKAVWYNQPYMIKNIGRDTQINISGKISFQGKNLIMQNPAYEVINNDKETTHTGRLVPIYRETRGLSSRWIRYILKNAIPYSDQIEENLPDKIREKRKLINISDAVRKIHFPENRKEQNEAKNRISYEELFFIQLVVLNSKLKMQKEGALNLKPQVDFVKDILKTLPFEITNAQRKALWQILKDTERTSPMNRLLEGDVGSGKTLVALLSCANAAKNGFQSAFMAPTEILASQHFNEAIKLFRDSNISVALVTSSESSVFDPELSEKYSTKRSELEKMIASGKCDIVIGTHSLIQEKVKFKELALVVLDEQHRFGVEQRAKLLKGRKNAPHLLSMTATPIPRTLAMTLYGDLDISVMDEMPKNRKKIITKYINPDKRRDAYDFIEKEVSAGRQVFVICPKIENNPPAGGQDDEFVLTEAQLKTKQIKAVKEEYEKLSKKIFPHLKVAMLHGKMKPKEKDSTMQDFKNRKYDILVSTSVIEVGVDVPNATIMMIEGSDRFGLAQLHQFRGRVGRGEHQSYCFLFSDSLSEESQKRLRIMEISSNGFELAEYDMKMRGPGDFLGKNQSGIPDVAMEALINPKLISEAQEDAKEILMEDTTLEKYPAVKQRFEELTKEIHFE